MPEVALNFWRSDSDLFDLVVNFPDRPSQFFGVTLPGNVHEVDLRIVEKEMIVQGSDAQPVVQRDR